MLGHSPLSSAPISALSSIAAGSAVAAAGAASTASAVGQVLQAYGAATATGTSSAPFTGVAIVVASWASTGTSATNGAIQSIKEIAAAAAGTSATSFVIGTLQGAAASSASAGLATGVSNVEARNAGADGLATSSVVGAWEGASGGDGVSTAAAAATQATALAFALATANSAADSTSVGDALAFASAVGSVTASGATAAETAQVLPMYGNGIMQWYDQSVVEGVSEVVNGLEVRAGAAVSDCTWMVDVTMFSEGFGASVATAAAVTVVDGWAAINGDAVAASSAAAAAAAVGVEDLYAASVGGSRVRAFVRAYSADGRQNMAAAVGTSTATGQSDYSVAPHHVTAYFESAALAELYGTAVAISGSTGSVSATSLAYSFRGELYDVSRINRLHVNTSQKEVWVYIGDHHGG